LVSCLSQKTIPSLSCQRSFARLVQSLAESHVLSLRLSARQ